jgi:hypothetical protein
MDTNAGEVGKTINKKILNRVEAAIKTATTEVAVRATAEMKGLIDKKRPYKLVKRQRQSATMKTNAKGELRIRYHKAKKSYRVYEKGNPPQPPQNRTGALRRSIRYKIKKGYEGRYVATIAPYMIYARHLEFGGKGWPSGTRYPFVEPTAKIMKANNLAREIYAKALRAELSK